jgi:small subunit ribosomal protein S8
LKSAAKKSTSHLKWNLPTTEYGPRVKGVQRVSKLSKRLYSGVKDLKSVKQGHGVMVVTTSKGVMTDTEARKQNVGGELLFKIW